MLGVGNTFPSFDLPSNEDNNLGTTKFNDESIFCCYHVEGVFYFYPKDFTFICPTEIKEMDKLVDENVSEKDFSGDNEFCKLNWKQNNDIIKNIRHPLVGETHEYTDMYLKN